MHLTSWRPLDEFLSADLRSDLATDMYEKDGNLVIEMQIPNVRPEDIQLNLEDHSLRVAVIREERVEEQQKKDYYFHEIRRGELERILPLPTDVMTDHAVAEYADGLLSITIPKRMSNAERKKIHVQSPASSRMNRNEQKPREQRNENLNR